MFLVDRQLFLLGRRLKPPSLSAACLPNLLTFLAYQWSPAPCCFVSLSWLFEKLNWSGPLNSCRSFSNVHDVAFRDANSNPADPYTVLSSAARDLQVTDERRCLTGCGTDSRASRILRPIDADDLKEI